MMRYTVLLLCFISMEVAAKDCQIIGKAPSSFEEKSVTLYELSDNNWLLKDSTIIRDSSFSFSLALPSSSFAKIVCPSKQVETELFLHGDTINIRLDTIAEVHGDDLVNAYAELYAFQQRQRRIYEVIKERCKDILTPNDIDKKLYLDNQDIIYSNVKEYIRTDLGHQLFKRYYNWIGLEKIPKLLETADTTKYSIPPVPLDYDIEKVLACVGGSIGKDTTFCNQIRKSMNYYLRILNEYHALPWKQLENQDIIDLRLIDIHSKEVSLLDHVQSSKKPFTLIEFSASWCVPCHEVIDIIKSIYKNNPKIDVVNISMDENHQSWLSDVNKYALPWKQYRLKEPRDLLNKYKIYTIPHSVLLDKEKIIYSSQHDLRVFLSTKTIEDFLSRE